MCKKWFQPTCAHQKYFLSMCLCTFSFIFSVFLLVLDLHLRFPPFCGALRSDSFWFSFGMNIKFTSERNYLKKHVKADCKLYVRTVEESVHSISLSRIGIVFNNIMIFHIDAFNVFVSIEVRVSANCFFFSSFLFSFNLCRSMCFHLGISKNSVSLIVVA